jgi:hemoglobin
MKPDIQDLDDIKSMVDSFYAKVQINPTIGPIFHQVVQNNWPAHLEKMYGFWQSILLNERTYSGSPFPPHARLPIDKSHFEIWLDLFCQNVDALFAGPLADEAKLRAEKIAQVFVAKLQYLKENNL